MSQSTHIEYIIAASNLHAYNYGLKGHIDLATHKKVASSVNVPNFTPKANLKIQVNDNEAPPENPRKYLARTLRSPCVVQLLTAHAEFDR